MNEAARPVVDGLLVYLIHGYQGFQAELGCCSHIRGMRGRAVMTVSAMTTAPLLLDSSVVTVEFELIRRRRCNLRRWGSFFVVGYAHWWDWESSLVNSF